MPTDLETSAERERCAKILDEMAAFVAGQRDGIPKRRVREFTLIDLEGCTHGFSGNFAASMRELLDRDFDVVTICAAAVRNGWSH